MASRDAIDLIDRIAAGLGVNAETRRMWRRRGKVPGRWQLPILEQAKRECVELEPAALIDLHATERAAQPRRRTRDNLSSKAQGERAPARAAWVKIDGRYRLPIPSHLLEAIGARPGDRVLVELEGNHLQVRNLQAVVAEVQDFVRSFVPDDVDLVGELIAERRREARLE